MKLHELFEHRVTRDIPPVIHFHEQAPDRLAAEVSEYIITGGYPEGHPQHERVPSGIHEQYVRLLSAIASEMSKPAGPELPASWISGFFGSGKSSFAKLLGLALDGVALPDGRSLAEAWLARDTSPRSSELRDAFARVRAVVDPIAVVFDLGSVARSNEHVHAVVVREVQKRLGYCADPQVAEAELKLERDGQWKAFEDKALAVLRRPWSEARLEAMADDQFSQVMHALYPEVYVHPAAWIGVRGGSFSASLSSDEAVRSIADMRERRAKGKTLFIVVDEVSQYVHDDTDRMLKLQSFVADLGARLKGRAWWFATGQQKLEESGDANKLTKLKDRFPEKLRVHLATTNIRDVVHKRLLQKADSALPTLRALFQAHRQDLRLFAYRCEDLTEQDFLEVYPLLPEHIDLVLKLTTALRSRSGRSQGDDQGVRGLLQLLGELFRSQKLADAPIGTLVTLDQIYEVQQTALEVDVHTSMARVLHHCAANKLPLAARAAKAVALLELIQENVPTTAELVSRCLYDRLDRGSQLEAVTEALETLRRENLLGYSDQRGYKLQSSAGEEWERERRKLPAGPERTSEHVRDALGKLVLEPEKPKLNGRPFQWVGLFSDGRTHKDVPLTPSRDPASITVSFLLLTKGERDSVRLTNLSAESTQADRVLWLVGESSELEDVARDYEQSSAMVKRYRSLRDTLTHERKRLLLEEEAKAEDLDKTLGRATAAAFFDGEIFFRGKAYRPRDSGPSFGAALSGASERFLPALYPHFVATRLSPAEVMQLIEPQLNAPSPKLSDELGILSLDAGKYEPTCQGVVPRRVREYLDEQHAASGAALIDRFGRPPYGYAPEIVRACVAGLLRAHLVRIEPESGPAVSAVRDAGVRDLFEADRAFKRATIVPAGEGDVTSKDRARICQLFEKNLGERLDREPDAIADAVARRFPVVMQQLRGVFEQLNKLTAQGALHTPVPYALSLLEQALEACVSKARYTAPVLRETIARYDALNDGLTYLKSYSTELTDEIVSAVRVAADVARYQLAQLEADVAPGVSSAIDSALAESAKRIRAQLASEHPWRDLVSIDSDLDAVRTAYRVRRRELLGQQERAAEAARGNVKSRDGFATLTADHAEQVLRPIRDALPTTDEDAIAPTLEQLRSGYGQAMQAAEEQAIARLESLRAQSGAAPVHKLTLHWKNREIRSEAELDALLNELRDRVMEQLKTGARVRLG